MDAVTITTDALAEHVASCGDCQARTVGRRLFSMHCAAGDVFAREVQAARFRAEGVTGDEETP